MDKQPSTGRRQSLVPAMSAKMMHDIGRSNSFNLQHHEDIFKVSFNFDELKRVLHSIMHDIKLHGERFKELDGKFHHTHALIQEQNAKIDKSREPLKILEDMIKEQGVDLRETNFQISQTAAAIDTRIDTVVQQITDQGKSNEDKLAVFKKDIETQLAQKQSSPRKSSPISDDEVESPVSDKRDSRQEFVEKIDAPDLRRESSNESKRHSIGEENDIVMEEDFNPVTNFNRDDIPRIILTPPDSGDILQDQENISRRMSMVNEDFRNQIGMGLAASQQQDRRKSMQKKRTTDDGMSKNASSFGVSDVASNAGGMRPSLRNNNMGVPKSGFIKLQQAGDLFDKVQYDKIIEDMRAEIKALQDSMIGLKNEVNENKTEAKQGDIAINSRISEQMRTQQDYNNTNSEQFKKLSAAHEKLKTQLNESIKIGDIDYLKKKNINFS